MNADKFYTIEIVDKFSRMFMLLFAGIVLGVVLALAYYNIFRSEILETIILMVVYSLLFFFYVSYTNAKRKVTKVEILKNGLSLVFEKKHEISSRMNLNYSDIKEYKIYPLSDKKNLVKENPDINKYSLRVYGFKTEVELYNGDKIEFQDSYSDGVLIYSPSYVYRMIDVGRHKKDFPLVLEKFESKKDIEDFDAQFRYYADNEANLPLFKNGRYLAGMLKYTMLFALIIIILASIIAYFLYTDLKDVNVCFGLIYITIGVLVLVNLFMYLGAFLTTLFGNILNKKARQTIKNIIEE